MKKTIFPIFILFFASLFFSGCFSANKELFFEKKTFLSAKDLKNQWIIPNNVFYDNKSQKIAIEYLGKKHKKSLIFYNIADEIPASFFNPPSADDVLISRFSMNSNITYGLLQNGIWNIFLKTVSASDAVKILSIEGLSDLVLLGEDKIFAIGKQKGIYPLPPGASNYQFVENFTLTPDQKLLFKAMKQSGDWIIYFDGKEIGPYSFVSQLVVSRDGKISYVARDLEDNWFTVSGDRKTQLGRNFQEIGQVFENDGDVLFSGVERGQNAWEIVSGNRVLVQNLQFVPLFIVKTNGRIVYTEESEKGVRYIEDLFAGDYSSSDFNQIDQLSEDGYGNIFAKVKEKTGLWKVVSDKKESAKYVWMSKMFSGGDGDIFFFGVTSNGDMEFAKFRNK